MTVVRETTSKSAAGQPSGAFSGLRELVAGSADHAPPANSGAPSTGRIAVVTLTQQPLGDDLSEVVATGTNLSQATPITLRISASMPDLARAITQAEEDYLVFSPRPGMIWDRHVLGRVEREIAALEEFGVPWFCLSADGMDVEGRQYSAGFFCYEPTLVPDRGRRLIVQAAGSLYVVKRTTLHRLRLRAHVMADVPQFLNNLILVAYGRGFASFFSSGLYPCIAERRARIHIGLDDQLLSLNPSILLHPFDAAELFPPAVPSGMLLTAWAQTLSSTLAVRHPFSFVIRTLFQRNSLLRRCLISIEYLRSSLGFPVEIVLASDSADDICRSCVQELAAEFPSFGFVVAHGGGDKGHSRVRNLVAGIRASSGARVCIIDDDDYYTPQAVESFAKACEFGTEWLVIFDTQIVVEKWQLGGVKPHREILAYSTRYDARLWANTLRGSNSVPLCGLIHPGWFVRRVAQEYMYDFDLSEDFIFHVMCFAHPERPPIRIVEGVGAYQSHRAADDNVSNVEDRTRWMLDTGNGVYQLLFEQGRTFDVIASGEVALREGELDQMLAPLKAEVARAREAQSVAVSRLAALLARVTEQSS